MLLCLSGKTLCWNQFWHMLMGVIITAFQYGTKYNVYAAPKHVTYKGT